MRKYLKFSQAHAALFWGFAIASDASFFNRGTTFTVCFASLENEKPFQKGSTCTQRICSQRANSFLSELTPHPAVSPH